jgi:tellurium resistance protein TerD
MSITLAKNEGISLGKGTLSQVAIGLGWDPHTGSGPEQDLDATALLLQNNGKVPDDQHFVFYSNLSSPDGSVVHTGDDTTGGNSEDGDDEVINVDLDAVPDRITSILFSVSIHDADVRRQSFGQVKNAYIRVVDRITDRELARYSLTDEATHESAIVFGALLHLADGSWKFEAVGRPYAAGLLGIVKDHGVQVR